jgi:hypothetical protein
MVGVIEQLFTAYSGFVAELPYGFGSFLNFFILVLGVVVYAVFIWHGYRLLAKKDILGLDLKKYNTYEHAFLVKFLAALLFFLENLIISPFVIFVGFSLFSIFLIVLTEGLAVSHLLITSAVILAAIRMTSYYKEDLSRELAKFLPFTLLAVSVLNPAFFDLQRVVTQFALVPSVFSKIWIYLLYIVLLEVVLRFFDYLFTLAGIGEPKEESIEEEVVEKEK